MECAAHLDLVRIEELIDYEHYGRGSNCTNALFAMRTKRLDL